MYNSMRNAHKNTFLYNLQQFQQFVQYTNIYSLKKKKKTQQGYNLFCQLAT